MSAGDISPESPEARRRGAGRRARRRLGALPPRERVFTVVRRVAVGVYTDGFTYAGNLAYLSLVTLFPFFIVAAALTRLVGRTGEGLRTLEAFLRTVPPEVAAVLRQPVYDVLQARTGNLLWFGAIVGLWTAAGFIETIRGILRQAYGVRSNTPFWRYRLGAIGMIVGAVMLAMMAFSFQVVLTTVEQFLLGMLPEAAKAHGWLALGRIAPPLALFGALYILFYSLTPAKYRKARCLKWPGAAFVTLWWMLVTALLPSALRLVGSYDLTYGSLAGVMIALIFFFFVGLGVVIGAELNAALAESPENGLEGDKKEADAA
ncbi:YihY/virulence factor BrkB family protein [Sphingomonas canadensis]|uniref:YihY/virulence factor BrkB family protein n=1 Tax=Sphingomonas canadensis TaxID=1219257 RepID=A0ABW3H6T3_9SPHN|nr:YihY/virulence factor BrkB family protein [Sphingomonas canadensis]MCW3834993.1 YihY/virulence factor BrkB family protein [Sphingomonas canadensis]